ncbi:MAG TPA: hypothetical protein VJM33_15340 [Microthrixaceae bacterium]|nr:hypothetical protein [Microthrixaceae bacterium]
MVDVHAAPSIVDTTATQDELTSRARRGWAIGAARWGMWIAIAIAMTYPGLQRLGTHLPGDAGDMLFTVGILNWGADRLPHLFQGYWHGPIFAGTENPMAYSETFLGAVPLFWLLRTVTRSPVIALNLLLIGAWAATSECTFRLARRITRNSAAAILAALCFTYATIHIAQYNHPQLMLGAPFIPLCTLLLLRVLERPSWQRGAWAGGTLGLLTITATYYGVFMLISSVVIAVTYLLLTRDRSTWNLRLVAAGGAYLVAMLAVSGPVAIHYAQLQQDEYFRRAYDPRLTLMLGDLRTVSPGNRFFGTGTLLSNTSGLRLSENYAFPGFVTLAFALIGLVVFARRRWWCRDGRSDGGRKEMLAVGLAGVAALAIAYGKQRLFGVEVPAFDLAATVVPGFKGVRGIIRLVIVTQLPLALLASVGVTVMIVRIRADWVRWCVVGVLSCLVLLESNQTMHYVRAPTVDHTGEIYEALNDLPPGRVLELPVADIATIGWAFTEAPRMAAQIDGDHPRLNGYSGWSPPDYPEVIDAGRSLPDRAALDEVLRRGVRYLVLHTEVVDPGFPGLGDAITATGDGAMTEQRAREIVDGLPEGCARQVITRSGGLLVELDRAACSRS